MKLVSSGVRFNKIILRLLFSRSFIMITIFGNLIIMGFAMAFYALESAVNPGAITKMDAIWWGFSTATTVGYGDIIPSSDAGKIIGIMLMLIGTALFATYTALFAETILGDEFFRLKAKSKILDESEFLKELREQRKQLDEKIKEYEDLTK